MERLIIVALLLTGTQAYYQESACATVGGRCVPVSYCKGSSVSGKCPTQPYDIKCCTGVYQEDECARIDGTCSVSCSGTTRSGYCPTQASNVRCCVVSSDTCDDNVAKEYACKLLSMHNQNKVFLKPNHFNSKGNNPYDGAAVLDNIKDTCNGLAVKRSSYCCSSGCSPGEKVCLEGKMVRNLYKYADNFWNTHSQSIQVNSLAGSCHSTTSKHYRGTTYDVGCTYPINHCKALENHCRSENPVELCYPGGPCSGHDTWVHCAFA